MRITLYKNNYGWFELVRNYKDHDDKKYISYRFAKCPEPSGEMTEYGERAIIDVIEWRHNVYQGNVSVTVFKWEVADELNAEHNIQPYNKDVNVEQEELPFY